MTWARNVILLVKSRETWQGKPDFKIQTFSSNSINLTAFASVLSWKL